MIGKLMNWFIEPFKTSFTKEIKPIHLKKKFFISCKWGFLLYCYNKLKPYSFTIYIPTMFSAYILLFLLFVSIVPISLSHSSDFVIEICRLILWSSPFLSYPIGRRVGMYIYRDIYEKHGIKGLPDEPSIWEMIKNLRKK